MRLALAQLNVVVGDITGNVHKIIQALDRARAAGADIVATPEMAVSGYPPEDLLLKPSFLGACRSGLDRITAACRGLTAIVGFPEGGEDLHNAAAVISDGEIAGMCRKQYLPNYGVFDEDRYFAPGTQVSVFTCANGTFGVSICEDIWYPPGPPELQATKGGAALLVNISASPYFVGKGRLRERMLATRASDNVAIVAYCNLVGGQDELVFDGASAVFDPEGNLLARGAQFEEDLVIVDLDLEDVHRRRLRDPRHRKQRLWRNPGDGEVRRIALPAPQPKSMPPPVQRPSREPMEPLAEIYRALVVGTRDYVGKNGFESVVLGLSGGIDSSLVACVAADAVGVEHVVGVAMPSKYTSDESNSDAADWPKRLECGF